MLYLWLITAGLIAYGSLYPFKFAAPPSAGVWQTLLESEHAATSWADLLGNIGLFLPYGLLGVLSLRRHGGPVACVTVGVSGSLLAIGLQVLQVYLPMRSPALVDVLWNLVGMGLGIGMAGSLRYLAAYRWFKPARLSPEATLVLSLWLMSELLPLVPSLDLSYIKDNLKPLMRGEVSISEALKSAVGALLASVSIEVLAVRGSRLTPIVLLAAVALGKVFIIEQGLTVSVLIGFAAGFTFWLLLRGMQAVNRSLTLTLALFAASFLLSLLPFDFDEAWRTPEMIPFASLLHGSMLNNLRSLAGRVLIYSGILWSIRATAGSLGIATAILTLWVALLETLQIFLPGHVADITEPLWVLLCGWGMHVLSRHDARDSSRADQEASLADKAPVGKALLRGSPASSSASRAWVHTFRRVTLYALVLTVAFSVLLHMPKIPYNVRELFLADGAIPVLFVFSLALLWTGASAAWVGGHLFHRMPSYWFFPAAVFGSAMVSLLLLYCSVTDESIGDIAGANNLYFFVTQKDIWGRAAREVFLWVNSPALVGLLERPVRFAALTAPLWFLLAIAFALVERRPGREIKALLLVPPLLWLSKAIAFDWSSTDNLNELIARDGAAGLGGGFYLYLLLALLCVNSALLTRALRRKRGVVATGLLTIAFLPIGWMLLSQGLEAEVVKYNQVFSGAQFLLGPDRAHKLTEYELILRWCLVQLGAVLIWTAGAHVIEPVMKTDKTPGPVARKNAVSVHSSGVREFVQPVRREPE